MANNDLAKTLKALHQPSNPIIFPNIWDLGSFHAVASLNDDAQSPSSQSQTTGKPVKAIATASWAVAASLGLEDEALTAEMNLDAVRKIAPAANKAGLPLSVDIQDGYGAQIESVVAEVVRAGAVGANIEDGLPGAGVDGGVDGSLYPLAQQVSRLQSALKAAADAGCPDFVLNARCDIFRLARGSATAAGAGGGLDEVGQLQEAIARGKAYLEAGATTVFYLGGGLAKAQVELLVRELRGRVAVIMTNGLAGVSTRELAELGVARISEGPRLYQIAMDATRKAALDILTGGTC